jgi:mannose-6-phosphate isomerase-like protein (cupin superfamily)
MKKRDFAIVLITILVMLIPMAIIAHKQNPKPNLPSSAFNWDSIKVVATKNGEKRQFFDSPTSTLENLEIHVSTLNPGEIAHPPHQHPEEELMIVKDGTVEALVNGKQIIVGAGSIVFQAANTLHSTKNVGTVPATYYAIKWKSAKAN